MVHPDPFQVRRPDTLGVLTSTRPVAAAGAPVRIDAEAATCFARRLAQAAPAELPETSLHCTHLPPQRFLNYLLLLEALNFCFWDEEPRWRVVYGGQRYDGYWALAAALRRGIETDGLPLWDAAWMTDVDAAAMAHLLRGEGRPLPLLATRVAHVREAGAALLARWGGQFARLVASCGGDATTLALRIAEQLPSFRDVAAWRGRPVYFYKRAQICVADLTRLLPGHALGRISGLEQLTAFADYKVPQVLRKESILVYDARLAGLVDAQAELAAGGEDEVAIRACTVWACELISRAASSLRGASVTAAEVDNALWSAGQDPRGLRPYHRTRTRYY